MLEDHDTLGLIELRQYNPEISSNFTGQWNANTVTAFFCVVVSSSPFSQPMIIILENFFGVPADGIYLHF